MDIDLEEGEELKTEGIVDRNGRLVFEGRNGYKVSIRTVADHMRTIL